MCTEDLYCITFLSVCNYTPTACEHPDLAMSGAKTPIRMASKAVVAVVAAYALLTVNHQHDIKSGK